MKHFLKSVVLASSLVMAGSASAALLDFTKTNQDLGLTDISGPNSSGNSLYNTFRGTFDGIGYTLSTTGGWLGSWATLGPNDESCSGTAGPAFACTRDGIGVANNRGNYDVEINIGETITLTFDEDVNFSAFHFLDLYYDERGYIDGPNNQYRFEVASYKTDTGFNGTAWADTPSDDLNGGVNNLGGYAKAQLQQAVTARSVTFYSQKYYNSLTLNDFALAGIEVSRVNAVPVPAAAFLFAPALVGFMTMRRKAAKKA